MVNIKILSFFLFILTLMHIPLSPAFAEKEYNIGYHGGTMIVVLTDNFTNLLPRDRYGIRAIRDINAPNTRFKLRFFALGSVTGCSEVGESSQTKKIKKGVLSIDVKDSEISTHEKKRRYTNYDCMISKAESFFDVEMNTAEILANNITKLKLKSNKYGEMMGLDIAADNNKIVFTSDYKDIPGMPKMTVKVTYWLYPPQTVILSVPAAKEGKNYLEKLTAFAETKGLKPLSEKLDGFRLADHVTDYAYFFDHSGKLRSQILAADNDIVFGKTQSSRTVYGAKGPVEEPYMMDVHISIPAEDQ